MRAPIHGSIFSSSVPGRKPMSSPSGIVTRVMMISTKRFDSSVCMRPAASVSSVLPVPAGPRIVTKSISGSMSRFSAKFCSRLRALTPQMLWRSPRKSRASSSVALLASMRRTMASMPSLVFLVHELVDVQVGDDRARDLVVRAVGFLPRAHVLAVRLPEVRRQRRETGVEHVGVLDRLVAVVVLGVHADDRGLDAQVDVLRHERDARVGVQRLQRQRLREDHVVGAMPRKIVRQRRVELAGLEEEPAGLGCRPRAAVRVAVLSDQRVRAAGPRRSSSLVASRIRSSRKRLTWRTLRDASDRPFLFGVELLEHDHR